MGNFVTCEVKGLDLLQMKLEDLPKKVAKKGVRKALRAGGEKIREAIVANAPARTGFLKDHFNIKTKMISGELAGFAFVGPSGKAVYPRAVGEKVLRDVMKLSKSKRKQFLKDHKGRVRVASVAAFLEFGSSKMSKKPFMTSSVRSSQAKVLEAVIESLKETLAAEGR